MNEPPPIVDTRSGRRARRWTRRLARGVLVLAAVWLAVSWCVAYQLTQRRYARHPEPAPAIAWGRVESFRLDTRDGQQIGAWFIEGRPHAPSVLLLHGNGGARMKCLSRAGILAGGGASVLLISLRAHGDSTGDFNDIGYSARHDVVAAVEYLERRRPGRPIVLHGVSLGSAAAVFASGELGRRVSGYVLESPYRDLRTAVRNRTENALPPVLDWLAYQGLSLVAPLVLPDIDAIAPVEAIGGVPEDVPVLIVAGGADVSARPFEAQALYDRVRSHGRLLFFKDAGHVTFPKTHRDPYRRSILDFVRDIETRFDPGVAGHAAGSSSRVRR